MDNYIIVKTDRMNKVMYVTNKTKLVSGERRALFTFKKFKAKFYMSEKVAQNRIDKLNKQLSLYDGKFTIEKLVTNVVCN